MLQKIFPNKRASILFISGLLVLLLVPALLIVHPGAPAKASGGGGCYIGQSPSVSIYPTTASPGSTISVNGNCFATNATVKVFFQTTSNGVVTVVTDPIFGSFFTQLTIPSTYVKGTRYFVHVNSNTFSVKVLFTFIKPSLSVSSQYGQQPTFGEPANASGSGFAANEAIDLTWDFGTLGTMKAGVAAADSSGFFFSNFTMPSIPFGVQTHLDAHGRISLLSASTLVSEAPALFDSPTQGVIGTTVNLNGGGYGSGENVKILFQGKQVAITHTNIKGAFTASFVVPSTATIGFQNNGIVAVGKTSGIAASAFFVVEPNVYISPNSGFSGTLITVRGSHFTPNGFAEILWVFPNGGSGGSGGGDQFISDVGVSSHGTFNTTISAPSGLVSGVKYFVLVIDGPTSASNQARFLAL
jgi:hypothetical protein